MAAAGRIQVANANRHGGEIMQILAKRLEAERLHMVLKICMRAVGIRPGERAQLAWGHAHRAGPF